MLNCGTTLLKKTNAHIDQWKKPKEEQQEQSDLWGQLERIGAA